MPTSKFLRCSFSLYVVKNPDKPADGGDWLRVKSGKFASVDAR